LFLLPETVPETKGFGSSIGDVGTVPESRKPFPKPSVSGTVSVLPKQNVLGTVSGAPILFLIPWVSGTLSRPPKLRIFRSEKSSWYIKVSDVEEVLGVLPSH
jgi:hypothetical protein